MASIASTYLAFLFIGLPFFAATQDLASAPLSYANSQEEALFNRIDELTLDEWAQLVLVVDDPRRSAGQQKQLLLELKEIAVDYQSAKYTRGSVTKRGLKVYKSLVRKFYRVDNLSAGVEDLIYKGEMNLNTFLVLLAVVYQELGIEFRAYTTTEGWFIELDPANEAYSYQIGESLFQTMELSSTQLSTFLDEYIRNGNTQNQPYTIDSLTANGLPNGVPFWKQIAFSFYLKNVYRSFLEVSPENSLSQCLKAHRISPSQYTKLYIYLALITCVADTNGYKDFWIARRYWTLLINNYQTDLSKELQGMFDEYAYNEIVKQGRIDSLHERFEYLHQHIQDTSTLKEISFSYHSFMAIYHAYTDHSRAFIPHQQQASKYYPNHIRMNDLVVNGTLNYVKKQVPIHGMFDTLQALAQILPEIAKEEKYKDALYSACLYAATHSLEKDLAKTQHYYQFLMNTPCSSSDITPSLFQYFFEEYSAYFTRKNQLSQARKILSEGIEVAEKCNFDSSRLIERYRLIKNTKSIY